MSWVNLNDIFLPKAGGGVISGDLTVSGTLTLPKGSSVGQKYTDNGVTAVLYLGMVFVNFHNSISFSDSWGTIDLTTLPEGYRPDRTITTPMMLQGDYSATPCVMQITAKGVVQGVHKGGDFSESTFGFAFLAYPANS